MTALRLTDKIITSELGPTRRPPANRTSLLLRVETATDRPNRFLWEAV
jgi:hypothetical protein